MHIAFLTSEFPSTKTGRSGGIGTSIKNLAEAFVLKGHRVSVFIYGQLEEEEFIEFGVRIYKIRNIKWRGLSWILTRRKIQNRINNLIRNDKVDVLEVPDWTGISAFMKIKCPVVMRLNGSDSFFCNLENRTVKSWNKFLELSAFGSADNIIAVSHFVGSQTNTVFKQNRRFTVIYNSINSNCFQPETRNLTGETILYFGTIIRKKGVLEIPHYFNEVVLKFPKAQLLIVGGDSSDINSDTSSTWELMKKLFSGQAVKNVTYLGPKSYAEISQYIATASVCIFPSYAECLPVSWLEAMAMAKPIVASNIGWATEMLEDGKEAYLVHPGNHEGFSRAIIELLEDKQKAEAFGAAARQKVLSTFSSDVIVEQNIDFYYSIINSK